MVLSVGYGARVQDALAWQGINNLTYPVLSDYPGYPVGVTLQYTNFLGNPTLPWDAILTTDQVVSFTGDSYAGGQWQIEEIEAIFDSLFDPQIAADPDTLDFGLVGQLPVQLVLVLDNAGTGLLNIQQISSSSPYFSPNITQDSIFAVDDSLLLTVTFDAPGFGEFNGVLTVAATQDTLEIPLSAVVPNAVEPTPSVCRALLPESVQRRADPADQPAKTAGGAGGNLLRNRRAPDSAVRRADGRRRSSASLVG
jgi:hypothetical protein